MERFLQFNVLVVAFAILVGGSFLIPSAYAIDDGLIAYYPFNGDAIDESGNGHEGTVFGPVLTTDRFGNTNSAYQFDGLNDYISASDHPDFTVTDVTVAAWIKTTDKKNLVHITSTYDTTFNAAAEWYNLFLTTGTGELILGVDRGGGVVPATVTGNTDVADGEWHFVVGVRDTSTTQLLVYVDGVLDGTHPDDSIDELDPVGDFWIGGQHGVSGRYINGVIDDVRVYNRSLSASEIMRLFLEGLTTPFAEFNPSVTHVHFGGEDKADHLFFAGGFLLDEAADEINLDEDDVQVEAGPLAIEVPAGSFNSFRNRSVWRGQVEGSRVVVVLRRYNERYYSFMVYAHGVDLTGWTNPEVWKLGIGNNVGETTQWLQGHLHRSR